eukprot:4368430-Pyramimonas_sp.AAC.2
MEAFAFTCPFGRRIKFAGSEPANEEELAAIEKALESAKRMMIASESLGASLYPPQVINSGPAGTPRPATRFRGSLGFGVV